MFTNRIIIVVVPLALCAPVACSDDGGSNTAAATGASATGATGTGTTSGTGATEGFDPSVCQPEAGGFTLAIDNPFYPLTVGQVARDVGLIADGPVLLVSY